MNTPTHYLVNLVLLGKTIAPQANFAITLGAILPDVPIFIFYFLNKFIYKLPEGQIWSQTYYEPFWQNLVALFHSIPIASIGIFFCFCVGWKYGAIVFISTVLHSLFDLPVHHDDAHRHFFPFSNYRFISPISYWNPKHYGNIVALVELLLVLALTPVAFDLLRTNWTKALVVAIDLFYLFGYLRFYLLSSL